MQLLLFMIIKPPHALMLARQSHACLRVHVTCAHMKKSSCFKLTKTPALTSPLPPYLKTAGEGCSLAVRAKPGAKVTDALPWFEGINAERSHRILMQTGGTKRCDLQACGIFLESDSVGVSISAPARDGEANQAITEFVASILGLRKHQVTLSKASTKSRDKVLNISGLSAEDALQLLIKAAG